MNESADRSMYQPEFIVRLAKDGADIKAAQRLRYEVFVRELGADGPLVDHEAQLECDAFDEFCDHLILFDKARPGMPAVGTYRLLRDDQLFDDGPTGGRYYSEAEYDISVLKQDGGKLLELGRSCLHREYRGGSAMMMMWSGLAQYIDRHEIDLLFGVASFHGVDIETLKEPLSLLHHRYLAPQNMRATALDLLTHPMDLLPEEDIDRLRAMRQMPALLKAYLRLGGYVAQGAFVDHGFQTTDVLIILETARITEKNRSMFGAGLKNKLTTDMRNQQEPV